MIFSLRDITGSSAARPCFQSTALGNVQFAVKIFKKEAFRITFFPTEVDVKEGKDVKRENVNEFAS